MPPKFNLIDQIVHRHRQNKLTAREAIYRLGRMSPADQRSAQTIRQNLRLNPSEWSLDKILDAIAQPPSVNCRVR